MPFFPYNHRERWGRVRSRPKIPARRPKPHNNSRLPHPPTSYLTLFSNRHQARSLLVLARSRALRTNRILSKSSLSSVHFRSSARREIGSVRWENRRFSPSAASAIAFLQTAVINRRPRLKLQRRLGRASKAEDVALPRVAAVRTVHDADSRPGRRGSRGQTSAPLRARQGKLLPGKIFLLLHQQNCTKLNLVM